MPQIHGVMSWLLLVSLLDGHATVTWTHVLVVVGQFTGCPCFSELTQSAMECRVIQPAIDRERQAISSADKTIAKS